LSRTVGRFSQASIKILMGKHKELLAALQKLLLKFHPSLAKQLKAGASIGEIDKVAATIKLTFTDGMYDLFTWKNGIKRTGTGVLSQSLLFPDGIPFSLSEAVHIYRLLIKTNNLFRPNFFPLFSGEYETILLIDLDEKSETHKMISLYSPPALDGANLMTIYDSLSSLLQTVIAAYNEEACRIDGDTLEVDIVAYTNIAGSHNPVSKYWRQ